MNKDLIISKYKELVAKLNEDRDYLFEKIVSLTGVVYSDDFMTHKASEIYKLNSELSLLQEQEEKVQRLKEILKEKKVSSNLSDAEKAELFELEQQLDIPYKDRFYHNDNPKQSESVDQSGIREDLPSLIKNILKEGRLLQAIKTYAEWKQCSLKDAKHIIDQYKYLMPKTSIWS